MATFPTQYATINPVNATANADSSLNSLVNTIAIKPKEKFKPCYIFRKFLQFLDLMVLVVSHRYTNQKLDDECKGKLKL